MTGEQLNDYLERGFLGKSKIKLLPGTNPLERPVNLDANLLVADSVIEHANQVRATWTAGTGSLAITIDNTGEGYWIPYLGNGANLVQENDQQKGLGTFTPAIPAGSAISWVATGPFSGCHAVAFNPGAGPVFAHVITPAPNYPCDTVPVQVTNISTSLGCPNPGAGFVPEYTVGAGFVFWTRIQGQWWVREVQALNGMVTKVGKKRKI